MSNDNNTVDLVSPEGQLGTVPKENAAEAMKQGFTTPTPEQLQEHVESKVYGNHFITSALQGAVKGALPFGIGVKLADTIGVPTEVQEKLAKYNPKANMAGEVAGAFAPTGLIGVAGKAGKLASGVTKLIGLGEEAGLAGKIATRLVGGAAEGATFGVSKVADDAVLGDPNVVAQHALSEIGTNALWGAGISGGLGLAASGVSKGLPAAREAMASLGEKFGATDALQSVKNSAKNAYASASSFVSGVPKEKILETFENLGKHEIPGKATEVAESLQNLHSTVDSALKETITGSESFTSATNEAIDQYLSSVDSIKSNGEFAKSFMYKSKSGLKVDPDKIEAFIKLANKEGGAESEQFLKKSQALNNYLDASNDLINQLDKEHALGAADPHPDIEGIRHLIDRNKGALEAEESASLSHAVQGLRQSHGLGEFMGMSALGHVLGVPHPVIAAGAGAIEALRNPIETINRLAKLQSAVTSSVQRIGKIADVLASNESKIGILATGGATIANRKDYDRVTKEIQDHSDNIGGLTDKLHANTAIMAPHAPAIVDAMSATAGRAIQFLSSKIDPNHPMGPLSKPLKPSPLQISSFNRYYEAVTRPISVLESVHKGTLTHESMEALQAVHPELLTHMRQAVMKSLANNKKAVDMPYAKKLMLTLFLGQDLDGSTNPISMNLNQAMLELSGQQAEAKERAFIGQPKPTQKGLSNISSSEQALTAQQKSSQRN